MAKKPVQVIEKKPSETAPPKKQQVAAYCRVSTMAEEQQSSLKLQVEYYTKYIKANSDWSFAGVYADRMSGISAKDRPEFQKLIRKCMAGKVDLILCKSVSRFGRNLIETLNILEKLKKHHVGVWFEDIQANSLDPRVFAALTIFSLHAQEESIAKAQMFIRVSLWDLPTEPPGLRVSPVMDIAEMKKGSCMLTTRKPMP